MHFEFVAVTKENFSDAVRLKIAPCQAGTVETVEECCREALEYPIWRPTIVRCNGENVGFAMYGLWINEGEGGRVWLDRFFIDARFQGKGLAKACLIPLLQKMHETYGYPKTYLSVYEDNLPAIRLYEKLGFVFNGERDINGELVMVREEG